MAKKRLKAIPLGGVGEIGKNLWVVEYGDDLVVLDCGLMFPEDEMLGIDLVIPDISYLLENREKIRGIVITHGHEDHTGALPYVLPQLNVPVYGTKLVQGLISVKLKEHRLLGSVEQMVIAPGDRVRFGELSAEFIRVAHSIPDAVLVAVDSPAGKLIYTGDFKFDQSPMDGKVTNFARLAELGAEGALVLVSDCTRVEQAGFTPSERVVTETFDRVFQTAKGRVLVTTFASNISRVQQAIQVAHHHGRKAAVVGRSMENNVAVARELDYLNIPDGALLRVDEVNKLPPDKILYVTTGSQGEPTSVLSRIANQEHRQIHLEPGDTVILSATPVPGNEEDVARTINNLFRQGVDVIYGETSNVHVSGHASREELRLMINLIRPQFVVPAHGEYRHMVLYRRLAEECGVPSSNILMPEIGSVMEFGPDYGKVTGKVTAGDVLVDGVTVGEVGEVVLRDRRLLSKDGVVIVVVTMDKQSGQVVAGPDVVSRGFVYARNSEELLEAAKERALIALEQEVTGLAELGFVQSKIKEAVGKFLYEQTRRRPMILPVVQLM
ncbi:MAG: ribonuclease J [Chloroflexota bacterium]